MINFEKLNVYQEAVSLAFEFYKLTKKFPKDETFGIVSQIRRASISVSLNIAEGSSRSKRNFCHFLDISRGSCYELIPLLEISLKLGYLTEHEYKKFYEAVDILTKRINALKKSVNRDL